MPARTGTKAAAARAVSMRDVSTTLSVGGDYLGEFVLASDVDLATPHSADRTPRRRDATRTSSRARAPRTSRPSRNWSIATRTRSFAWPSVSFATRPKPRRSCRTRSSSVWRKLDTFKGDSQFGSWLYRVATNTALMRLRAQRRHPEMSTEELARRLPRQLRSGAGGRRELGQTARRRAAVGRAAAADPEGRRRAARDLPDRVHAFATSRGCRPRRPPRCWQISVPTVKTRLHRARIALRDAITHIFDKS